MSELVTPLDRPKATESLGGFGRTRTIITPLDRHKCQMHHLGTWLTWTIATPTGGWSCPTMVMPLDRLKQPPFCKWFYLCLWLTLVFLLINISFVVFLNRQILRPVRLSIDRTRSILNPGTICPVWFFVNILLRSNTVFTITRHGLHGKPALYTQELLSPPTVWVYKPPL